MALSGWSVNVEFSPNTGSIELSQVASSYDRGRDIMTPQSPLVVGHTWEIQLRVLSSGRSRYT